MTKAAKRRSSAEMPKEHLFKSYEVEKHLRNFCRVTSDELGKVLGAITGELDYALGSNSANVRDRAMGVALAASERALILSRNLRYFAIHTRLDARQTDVSQIVLDAFDLFEKELEARRIHATCRVEAACFAVVDSSAIQQVICNLLSNASHTMPEGGKLSLGLRLSEESIEISCKDNGLPLPPHYIEKIFEPYPEHARRLQPESEDLGLAVAKALVEAHGGVIMVESQEEVGNTFTIRLPFDRSTPAPTPFPVRRRHRRARVSLFVEFSVAGGPMIKSELSTLSENGGFINIPDPHTLEIPEVNAPISLKLSYFWNLELEIPKARVASVSWTGMNTGIGVEFIEVNAKARKILSAIVKSHAY